MGSMSMSDAAPLPRLGEVFFDVRSPSRSLRISWYADTGVAVLSIWQGGTCTGSFRLPMGDLPRMIETLQRGPDGQGSPAGDYPPQPAGAQQPGAPVPGARVPDYPGEAGHPGAAAGYDAYQAGPGDSYQAGPGSLHYLNGSAPAQYPDQTGAGYMAAPATWTAPPLRGIRTRPAPAIRIRTRPAPAIRTALPLRTTRTISTPASRTRPSLTRASRTRAIGMPVIGTTASRTRATSTPATRIPGIST